MAGSISSFIESINRNGGLSLSNGYDVEFDFTATGNSQLASDLNRILSINTKSSDGSNPGYLLQLLCDEAQLPSLQSATGQITGKNMGEGPISYPHTKLYSDFSLSWMCDANMTPLKFVNLWYNYIFNGDSTESIKTLSKNRERTVKEQSPNAPNRYIRLKYPENYLATLRVTKTERGKSAPNSRASMSYIIEECYPYSIDAVPLSYGASQVTKVTANFYYTKHTVVYNDIRDYLG